MPYGPATDSIVQYAIELPCGHPKFVNIIQTDFNCTEFLANLMKTVKITLMNNLIFLEWRNFAAGLRLRRDIYQILVMD
jgi:hypothetical protein